MTTPTPKTNAETQPANLPQTLPSPLRCLIAAVISAIMSLGCYLLTSTIAQAFANKPLPNSNITVLNIAIAVRTLVVGISTLATAIFGIVAIGLVALAIQVMIQQFKPHPPA